MTRRSQRRSARLLLSMSTVIIAYLLVMANSAGPVCPYSEDFEGVFDITTSCTTDGGGVRTGRVRIFADGVEREGDGEWRTTVTNIEGGDLVDRVVSEGRCNPEAPAKVRSFRIFLTKSATEDAAHYVCASSVFGTIDTTCDEEIACADCEEDDDVCTITVDAVEP